MKESRSSGDLPRVPTPVGEGENPRKTARILLPRTHGEAPEWDMMVLSRGGRMTERARYN